MVVGGGAGYAYNFDNLGSPCGYGGTIVDGGETNGGAAVEKTGSEWGYGSGGSGIVIIQYTL